MQISDDISFILLFFLTSLLVFVFSISLFRSSKREKQNINPTEEKIGNQQKYLFLRTNRYSNYYMMVFSILFMIGSGIMVLASLVGIIAILFA